MADLGHNNPPEAIETFKTRVESYRMQVGHYAVITDFNVNEARDAVGYGGDLAKEIDAQRDVEKRPHLEAGRKIDGAYKPLVTEAETLQKALKKTVEAFVVKREDEARKKAAAAAQALREAEEARLKAEAEAAEPIEDPFLAATAEPIPDTKAMAAAAKLAEAQAAASSRVSSAAGGYTAAGLRTIRKAKVTDFAALVQHYAGHREVKELCERLANADIRHAKGNPITIGGVEIVEERVL